MSWIWPDRSRPPIVNGTELEEGYGVEFGFEEVDTIESMDLLTGEITYIRPPQPLCAWVTKQNWNGEYERHEKVWPGVMPHVSIRCWDQQGRAWEYENGTMTITEDKLDLETEYEEDE